MKNKILVFVIVALFFSGSTIAKAQSKNATASSNIAEDEIQNFKDKIASKVAELTKQEQKAVSGFVIKTGNNQLSIITDDNQTMQVKIDDILTKIYQINGAQKKEIKLTDIVKNDYLIVNGPTSDTTVTANYIFVDEKYLVNVGKITEVDKENFSLKITTLDKETITLEIETATKQLILDIKTLELYRAGFSKIKEGDTVHFVVKQKQANNKETIYSAVKILIIPQEYFIK